jgi:catechol 2,3-dioxygenase-like lactoylglutathione lyase family enzyme
MGHIIPTLRCRSMHEAIVFYTEVLDFKQEGTWPTSADPSFTILRRESDELHLSSHSGDGVFGSVVAILTKDAGELLREYRRRGLSQSGKTNSPVHQGVVNQTWGTREFYVDDPSGNTLRFVER